MRDYRILKYFCHFFSFLFILFLSAIFKELILKDKMYVKRGCNIYHICKNTHLIPLCFIMIELFDD